MINAHLHILHLPPVTPDPKINKVAEVRLTKLMQELEKQEITDYTIIDGFYERVNRKIAIHLGHRRIIELAKQQGLENCIIAEDDIYFTSPFSFKYFLSEIPKSYDLFCGLIYSGKVEGNRIMGSASGIMTLYSIHSRFYDFFLSLNPDTHVDREIGKNAQQHEFYVVNQMCVTQRGGYSIQLRQTMFYDAYLVGKQLYIG